MYVKVVNGLHPTTDIGQWQDCVNQQPWLLEQHSNGNLNSFFFFLFFLILLLLLFSSSSPLLPSPAPSSASYSSSPSPPPPPPPSSSGTTILGGPQPLGSLSTEHIFMDQVFLSRHVFPYVLRHLKVTKQNYLNKPGKLRIALWYVML